MLDTILIGTSGLLNHSKGLRIVGNNLANVNTPGFKSSQLEFSNLIDQGSANPNQTAGRETSSFGNGLSTLGSRISFKAGLDQATGNPLDLAINGDGFYTVKRGEQLLFTRSGDFRFDENGVLVNMAGDHVQALNSDGQLVDVTLTSLERSMPKATTTVKFAGNLNATIATPATDFVLNGVSVYDATGQELKINLTFKNNGGGDFTVTITNESGTTVHTGNLKFASGFPTPATNLMPFLFTPPGGAPFTLTLDFTQRVTSLAQPSTLAMSEQDGYEPGLKVGESIGDDGTVTLHYSNAQTVKGPRLALANFRTDEDVEQVGGGAFVMKKGARATYGHAGANNFGSLVAGHREGSNVDMAAEFSNLILMQRGYQASSHVVKTANEMIQELFELKGR